MMETTSICAGGAAMTLTAHDGQLRLTCDGCGRFEDTGLEHDGSIRKWLSAHGWTWRRRGDGDWEDYCAECDEGQN